MGLFILQQFKTKKMVKEPTIAASAILGCESEEELNFLEWYSSTISGVKVIRKRQLASNYFELEVYCEDITDVYFLGVALGKEFPNRNYSPKYSGELEEEN